MRLIDNTYLWSFLRHIKHDVYYAKWRKANGHNFTYIANHFDQSLVSVGRNTYGPIEMITYGDHDRLEIGSFVSIADKVKFLLETEHHIDHLSTYPYKARLLGQEESFAKGGIKVEDDVWLGYEATVLSGVTIGRGAVIAAGAVVAKDIPPYAVAGGVPARVIKYRFEPEVIDFLMTLDYSKLTDEMVKEHIDELYLPLEGKSADELRQMYGWFPKK